MANAVSTLEVQLSQPSVAAPVTDVSSLEILLAQANVATTISDKAFLDVLLNSSLSSSITDRQYLEVFLNNNISTSPTKKTFYTDVILTPTVAATTTFDTAYLDVLLIPAVNPTVKRITTLDVFLTGSSRIPNQVTAYEFVNLTDPPPGPVIVSTQIDVNLYNQKYVTLEFKYPKSSNQPAGFEVVVYRQVNNEYDPNNKNSYLRDLSQIKQAGYMDTDATYYIYKFAWLPLASDVIYPFKIAVRSVYFSGKSDWVVVGSFNL